MSASNQDLIDFDLQHKRAHGNKPLRANFYWFTGELPVVKARDFKTARIIVNKLMEARIRCAPLTSGPRDTWGWTPDSMW
jgi:hypothetical protein